MMFSSNQILEISGPINNEEYLLNALGFALKTSGDVEYFTRTDKPTKCVYQITEDGTYCIGWAFGRMIESGWNEFPFDFDLKIIAQIIVKHLSKQDVKCSGWDGSHEKGFLMKAIETSYSDEKDGIKNPSRGIVKFKPFICFYHK